MNALDVIRDAQSRTLADEDGRPVELKLASGLSDEDIDRFSRDLPCRIPPEIRGLLRCCRGFSGTSVEPIDFTGRDHEFEMGEVFPHGLPIAADGYGNYWVVDLQPGSTDWAPIYFACHDAPVILYQSASLEEFLRELFALDTPPHKSLVDDVHEDRLFEVWRTNPGVLSHGECLASSDPDLSGFAQKLGESFQFVDLRNAEVGFGFSWGRYGPQTVVRRCGNLPVFAYQKAPRKGFFGRIFGH